MNVAMDSLAKFILRQSLLHHDTAPLPVYTFGLPPISCHTVPIESALVKTSVATIATLNIREYWVNKFDISLSASLSLNWTSFGRAFKAIGFSRQIFMRKWLSQTVPVGATLRKRKSGTDNRCPRCNSYDETTQHVLTCPDKEVKTHRTALLTALFTTVRNMDTCPLLAEALELVVYRWLRSPLRFRLDSCQFDSSLSSCMQRQHEIGWFHFFCGFHSLAIVRHQQHFFKRKRCQKSAPYWASKLTRAFWTFVHEMWANRTAAKHDINELGSDAPEVSSLREASLLELQQGPATLPLLYRHYFNITTTSLLTMSNTDLRIWFKSVRIFREATSTSVVDVFSSPGPLRSWVGLGPVPPPPASTLRAARSAE